MKRNFRIIANEEIEKEYFPIVAFFNVIPDSAFIRTLEFMIKEIGTSFNDVHCEFPGDLDPDDDMFEGVRFAVLNEEVIFDHQKLFYFLNKASQAYIEDNPQDKEVIQHLLRQFCNNYDLDI